MDGLSFSPFFKDISCPQHCGSFALEVFMSAYSAEATRERAMLSWAITFFIIAIIAAVLGFGGIAGSASSIAQILFLVFLILAVVSFFKGRSAKL